ncbi:MAG: methyltransferase domain-containing protein [Pseudomonadota bacterium]
MTTPADPLFDWNTLARRRDRAMRKGFRGRGDFLYRQIAEGLRERLEDVTRSFAKVALIGGAQPLIDMLRATTHPQVIDIWDVSPAMAKACNGTALTSETLPLTPGHYDLAISCLAMHWANDPVGHLVQLRRALKPDGLMIAALFGGQTLTELRSALAEAEVALTGGLSPRIAPMGEIRDLGSLLQRATLAMPVADSERLTVTYASPRALMHDLRLMGETNVLSARGGPMTRALLARSEEIYRAHFPAEKGRIRATFEIVYLTGWSPGPGQPVPLRPGSATTRLADALGTVEQDPRPGHEPGDT